MIYCSEGNISIISYLNPALDPFQVLVDFGHLRLLNTDSVQGETVDLSEDMEGAVNSDTEKHIVCIGVILDILIHQVTHFRAHFGGFIMYIMYLNGTLTWRL